MRKYKKFVRTLRAIMRQIKTNDSDTLKIRYTDVIIYL